MKKSALFLLLGVGLWACQDQVVPPAMDDLIVGPSFGKPPKPSPLMVQFLDIGVAADPLLDDDHGWCQKPKWDWGTWPDLDLDFSSDAQIITGRKAPPYEMTIDFGDEFDDPELDIPCPDDLTGVRCCDLDEDGVAWLLELSNSGPVRGTLEVGVGGVDSHIRLTGEFERSDGKAYGYLLNTWPGFYPPSRCEPWEDAEGIRTTWLKNGMIGIHVWPAGKKGSKFRMRNTCYGIVDFQYNRWEATGSVP